MFTNRVTSMNPSAVFVLKNRANKLREKGHEIISFGIGEPDFSVSDNIKNAIKDALDKNYTHYTASQGIKELRIAIAEKYTRENNVPVDWENVLVTPSKHAIFMTLNSLIEKGDEIILPNPSWFSFHEITNFTEGKGVFVSLKEEKGFDFDIDMMLEKITDKTKVILINTPSNPTGSMLSYDNLKAIRDIAIDKNLFVISDEIYEKIIYEGKHTSIASMDGMLERTITINGFSKSHAMAGLRVGYVIAQKPIIQQINKIQAHSLSCVSSIVQHGALAALNEEDSVKTMVDEFKNRRDYIVKRLCEVDGFSGESPKGAFYYFPKFDFDMNSQEFSEFLLNKAHVVVIPGSVFGTNGEKHIRISFSTSLDKIKKGVEKIEESVKSLF